MLSKSKKFLKKIIKSSQTIILFFPFSDLFSSEISINSNKNSVRPLANFEKKVFSQFGQDGIIEEIFDRIGTTNKYFVEFGGGLTMIIQDI